MVSFTRSSRLLAVLVLSSALGAFAADDIYMQLPGIKGESRNSTHVDWIEVTDFSGCVSTPVGTGGTGKSSACEVTISKVVDRSSTYATSYLTQGKTFGSNKVLIDICTLVGGSTYICYYKIEMNNVVFTAASTSGATGADRPVESWSMTFSRIKWTHTYIDPATGKAATPVSYCWDFEFNTSTCP